LSRKRKLSNGQQKTKLCLAIGGLIIKLGALLLNFNTELLLKDIRIIIVLRIGVIRNMLLFRNFRGTPVLRTVMFPERKIFFIVEHCANARSGLLI